MISSYVLTSAENSGNSKIYTVDFALNPSQPSELRIISLTTDKQNYAASEDVLISATIENQGSTEIEGLVVAEIHDMEGNVIAQVAPSEPNITLAPSANVQTTIQWNTDQFSPGDYSIILKVIDPATVSYTNLTGNILAERAASVSITSSPALGGAISLTPPVTQANMQVPIAITAALRNTGNIPITTTLRLEVTFNGDVVYTTDSTVTDLQVNNIVSLDLGNFIPQEGGDYPITLSPLNPSIASNIIANLYVGSHAVAAFTVTPDKALPGDAKVSGRITLTGIGASTISGQFAQGCS
jgi:hypothetical protein